MRASLSDQDSVLSASPDSETHAGPSSAASFDGPMNGHTNGNGVATNGIGTVGNGSLKHGKAISQVNLPGTTLYDDSFVDREEFVRLVIQSLRDVGYIESAATLEAESGCILEAPEVTQFRQYILDGIWSKAEAALTHMGITDVEHLWDAKFLISQQKYLELIEAKKTTAALHVLRNELAPLSCDAEQLHGLSSLIMCSESEDLRRRAAWDGAAGTSRNMLLHSLHHYIPPSVMVPRRRFATLLQQARAYQRLRCVYHNSPAGSTPFSLYVDHTCDAAGFPKTTTTILEVHIDEVWNMEWSHDGNFLASASKDKSAIIWRLGSSLGSGLSSEWSPQHILKDHPYPVGCLAWSIDDTILLTSAENYIKMWNTKTGTCLQTLEDHTDTVTALSWLPDGSGFISGGLDRHIIHWDADGKLHDTWGATAIRVTDLAVTPDFTRLVTVGMDLPSPSSGSESGVNRSGAQAGHVATSGTDGNNAPTNGLKTTNRMIVFDLRTKQQESSIPLEGELTSVKVSQNSQYALINHAPDEIHLWDLRTCRLVRKYTGQRQGRHVIRSCFGGIEGNFVVSGSEDGHVYIWQRDTGNLLEVLAGHGHGSVNSVAWHPRNPRMFASCSDDHTIRIWEAPKVTSIRIPNPYQKASSGIATSSLSNGKGKGKTRQRWDEEGVELGSGSN